MISSLAFGVRLNLGQLLLYFLPLILLAIVIIGGLMYAVSEEHNNKRKKISQTNEVFVLLAIFCIMSAAVYATIKLTNI